MALEKKPKKKLLCRQGKTFRHKFYFQDSQGNYADLSGFTARCEIRSAFPDDDSVASDDDVLIRLETVVSGDGIIVEELAITMQISAATTAAFPEGAYFYEPELVSPSGDVIDFVAPSAFTVLPEVTL